jgi:hypothetical protein
MSEPFLRFRWDKSYGEVNDFLKALPRSYERERAREMRNFGTNTLVALQMKIASGETGVPLSPAYLRWKERLGLDTGRLVRTRHYYYNLSLTTTDTGFEITPTGIEPAIFDKYKRLVNPNPQSYDVIAKWLEYGTKRMPARPHWRPVAFRAEKEFPQIMANVVEAAFRRARRGRYGGSPVNYSVDVREDPRRL